MISGYMSIGDMSPKMSQGADTLELNGMGDDGVLGDSSMIMADEMAYGTSTYANDMGDASMIMADEAVLDMGAFYDDWLFYIKKNKVTFGVVAGVSVLAIVGLIVWKMRKG